MSEDADMKVGDCVTWGKRECIGIVTEVVPRSWKVRFHPPAGGQETFVMLDETDGVTLIQSSRAAIPTTYHYIEGCDPATVPNWTAFLAAATPGVSQPDASSDRGMR